MNPSVYIIAGPNGAGKTTFAREFLPKYADCTYFVNADIIAQSLSPSSPEIATVRAGKLMLEEIRLLTERQASFGFETTLSGRAHLNLIGRLKKRRYVVNFFYLWVPSVEIALSRVRGRVSGGGHDIPEPIVRRRFERSAYNFMTHYRKLADSRILFNNSTKYPTIIAFDKESKLHKIDTGLFDRIIAEHEKK